MKQRTLLGLGLIAVGLGFVAGSARRDQRGQFFMGPLMDEPLIPEPFFGGPPFGESFGEDAGPVGARTRAELEAAPLLLLRGAFNSVVVVAGDGPRIVVTAPESPNAMHGFFSRRVEDENGASVVVDAHPRTSLHVTAPHGTALKLMFAKSRISVTGLDDIDVQSAKGKIHLSDVAGALRIRSALESIDVELAHDRETRSVDVSMAKGNFAMTIPAARGGDYRITAANSGVSAPPAAEGGIPITIRAARSKIAISAA